jgi:endonuclease/exonuclease/phosphatase family metal-dependent hydrolase
MSSATIALVAVLALAGVSVAAAPESEPLFTVDKGVKPIRRELQRFKDAKPRLMAAIADASGRQQEFVEDELMVTTASVEALNRFLLRWQGKVLATYAAKEKGKPTRYLVRINPDLARADDLERYAQAIKFRPQAHYRLSSTRGLRLLAAAAREKSADKSEKASDHMDVEAHWVPYADSITAKSLDQFAWLEEALEANCGYLLRQEMQLLQQLVNGGPNAAEAEQRLLQQIPNEDCVPPSPTFDLIDGLVLPEVDAGSEILFILQPPANIPQGFTADIVNSQGGHVSQAPYGGTLYGGSVSLNTDGRQLALATQPTFVLPDCARTETFTIRLTHANGATDFQVTLPVRLEIPGLGVRTYTLAPGQNVNIALCAAGDRGARQWSWIPGTGDPFPPPGLSLVTYPNGNAAITGTANTASYQTQGALQVQHGSDITSAGVQLVITVGFSPVLSGSACGQHRVTPDVFFRCEMPRPIGYNSSTWAIAGGSLPAGLSLVPQGSRWYLEGTIPFWSQACPLCDPFSTLGMYAADFSLTVPGFNGVAATRRITFDVGIPFRVLTQNTQLRPSANPWVSNTGDDNHERTEMLLDVINARTFDIIALQEVFDEEQRDQLSAGYAHDYYNHVWGPDENDLEEESGVALIVKGNGGGSWGARQLDLESVHYTEVFSACDGDDCWANKGFSATAVRFGTASYIWVVNTHLQAGQHSATRQSQLTQIMNYVNALPTTGPVLLLGDLNIAGGGTEYTSRFADVLSGWEDAVIPVFGDAALPITADKTRNAYAHFWHNENHIREHELEDLALQGRLWDCVSAAGGLFQACNPPIPHPAVQERLDHILIRQGTEYRLVAESVQLEDTPRTTALCRDQFQAQYSDPSHGALQCYLADHFGLSASLRLTRP